MLEFKKKGLMKQHWVAYTILFHGIDFTNETHKYNEMLKNIYSIIQSTRKQNVNVNSNELFIY